MRCEVKASRPHLSPKAFFQQWPEHTRVKTLHDQPYHAYIGLFHDNTGPQHYLITGSNAQHDQADTMAGLAWVAVQLSTERVDAILSSTLPWPHAFRHPEWDVVVKVTLHGQTVKRVEFIHPAYLSEKEIPDSHA